MTHLQPVPERAGWFDDPDDAEQLRYFDGIIWTDHTTPRRTVWERTGQIETTAADTAASAGSGRPSLYAPHQSGSLGHPRAGPGPVSSGAVAPGQHAQQSTDPSGHDPSGQRAPQYYGPGHQPGPTTRDGVPLATMGARLGAWLIDSAITWAIGLVLGGFFFWRGLGNYPEIIVEAFRSGATPADAGAMAQRVQFDLPWMGVFAIVQLIVGVGYHTYFLSRTGATIGKRAAGISVRLEERHGVLTAADAMRRSMLRPVLFMFASAPGLSLGAVPFSVFDALSGIWHPQRQTLHDRVGRTVVVRGSQPPTARRPDVSRADRAS